MPAPAILPLGDPRLRRVSEPVASGEPGLGAHLKDMVEALASFRADNGWGRALALPQLGTAKRAVVFDLGSGPFFMLNPVVEWTSPETFEVWDDCMCAPSIAVRARRARSMTVSFIDELGASRRMEHVSEDVSELLQHELDHLEGVLLTDNMLPEWGVVQREARDIAQPFDPKPK